MHECFVLESVKFGGVYLMDDVGRVIHYPMRELAEGHHRTMHSNGGATYAAAWKVAELRRAAPRRAPAAKPASSKAPK